jgi:hypothetical protein
VRSSRSFLASSALLAALVACHGKPDLVQAPPLVGEVLHSVRLARAELKTIRAETRTEFRGPGRNVRFQGWMLARYPDRFFLEAGGFGFPVSQASVAGDEVKIYVPARSLYYRGDGPGAMAGLLGIEMSSAEWISLVLGYAPELKGRVVSARLKGDTRTIQVKDGEDLWTWKLDGSGWLEEVDRKGPRPMTIRYGRPMDTNFGSFPSRLSIWTARGSLSVGFQKVEANPEIPDALLGVDVPPGIPARPIEAPDILVGR